MQRTRITRGTTSIYRETQPHPILTDRKRNIGRTRLRLLDGSAEPLRKEFGAYLLAALHRTAALWKKGGGAYYVSSSRLFLSLYHFLGSKSTESHRHNRQKNSE